MHRSWSTKECHSQYQWWPYCSTLLAAAWGAKWCYNQVSCILCWLRDTWWPHLQHSCMYFVLPKMVANTFVMIGYTKPFVQGNHDMVHCVCNFLWWEHTRISEWAITSTLYYILL